MWERWTVTLLGARHLNMASERKLADCCARPYRLMTSLSNSKQLSRLLHQMTPWSLSCAALGLRFCSSAPGEHAGQQRLIHLLETQHKRAIELGFANLWFCFALFLACTGSTGYPLCSSCFFFSFFFLPLFPSKQHSQGKKFIAPFDELATVAASSFSKALAG